MRPLSATECISPALERTRDLLGRPFRWGTFLKIAAVAFFAQMGGSFSSSFPNGSGSGHSLPPALLAFIVAFAVIIGLISFAVGLVLFYIGSRLQLVLVELVATRQTLISPMWRRVGPPTWRWIGLKLLYLLASVVLLCALALPIVLYFFVHHVSFAGLSFGSFFHLHLAQIILGIAAAIVVLLAISVVFILLRDFALPYIALQDLGISESMGRLRHLLNTEPGPVALFLVLRMVLGFGFTIVAEIALVLAILISLIPCAVVGGVLWLVLHNAGPAGTILLIVCAAVGGLIFLCWIVCLAIAAIGPVYIFIQAYALYFLGGRYPMLGDLLDRSTPPPAYAYPMGFPQPLPPQYPTQPPPVAG